MCNESMFLVDIKAHYDDLKKKIESESVFVIDGAGSIGSSFIHEILPFHTIRWSLCG